MSVPTKILTLICVVLLVFCAGIGYGSHATDKKWKAKDVERKLSEASAANQAWAERWTLQAQLATRDQQLAEAQAKASQVRTVEVIKREVVYRDRIKEVAVRDCVRDSGLLQLYDAALGLSDTAE